MQYKIEDKIQHRIIRSENVMDIARFCEKIAKEESGTCTFRIRFSDKNYEVEHSSQLFESPAFKYKDASSIEFLYESADCCSRISLSLYECIIGSAIMNKYIVESENKTWLNRKEKALKELIDGIQKQSILRKVFCFPWMFIVLFAVYALEVVVLHSFGFYYDNLLPITNIPSNTFVTFLPMRTFVFAGMLASMFIIAVVACIYPEQEFAFGGTRHRVRMEIRKGIGFIITTILIPLLMTLLL